MYRNYIFDLDGTLLDTLCDLAASTNYALRQYGMPEHSIDSVRTFVGNGVGKLIERAVPEGIGNTQYESVLATFRKHYMDHSLDTTKPYPGIEDMRRELRSKGCRVAVVSNKFYDATRSLCRHFFPDTVEVAIGERQDIRRKPAPDTVIEAMRQLGIDRKGTVYVGDSEVDIATARNSSIPCISVLWGFRDKEFLASHGATTFVSSPEGILRYLC